MIDLSSFYQESGESWADMMDEENEDEEDVEKNNNKSHSSDCHDATDSNNKLNPNESTSDVSSIEKENGEADVKETVDENNKNDNNDKLKEYYENIESTIKRIEALATTKTIRKKESGGNGRGGTGGIVWRLPSEEQKKQQQEVIQQLVRQRQNIDAEDNWRRPKKELDDKTQWRSNKPYRAPEKNNSKQWHLYSEELQVEYEEQVEESRKEFQRKFGTKSASNDNDSKTKPKEKPEPVLPLADPVKPSILISADGPSDWADDIPDTDDDNEEEEKEEEGFTEQSMSELKQELSRDATASSPDHSDRSIDAATYQPSASDHFNTQSPQKNVDRIITSPPPPARRKLTVDNPSPWISFAEQNSSRSPASTTTTSVTTDTQEDKQDEMEKDEQLKNEQLEEAEQSKFEESKEDLKDESKESKPVPFVQEDSAISWNTFAEQSTSKWATTTRVSNDALSERISDNTGAMATQKYEQKQGQEQHHLNAKVHHQRRQSTSESIASNNDKIADGPKDSIIQSPQKQILNHLSKNINVNKGTIQQQRGSPPSKTHSNLGLPSTAISESNTVSHHDSDDSINQHNESETLSNGPKIHDDVKNWTSRQDNTDNNNNNSDVDWRAGTTWNTSPSMDNLDNDGLKSHSSWKNNSTKSSGVHKNNIEGEGASAAWTALAANNDDDTRSHGSRKSDNVKPKKEDNDSWRGGTTWNHIPGTGSISGVDDDVKSHTSRASHTSRKSGIRSHFGNENERASAAWIAAGVQVKRTHSDHTRRKHETRRSSSEHDNGLYGSATWNAGSTMDNDVARSHSSYKSSVKKNGNGRTSDTWTSTTGNKDGEVQNPQGERYNDPEQDDIWKESAFATWGTSTTVTSTSIPAGSGSVSQNNSKNITAYSNVNDGERASVTWMKAKSTVNTDIVYNDTILNANNEINGEKEKTDDTSNQSKWQAYARQHSSTNGDRQLHARGHNNSNQRPWS